MKTLKLLSKISLIALITFAFITLTNVTFAQNKIDNKQTVVKQDTIVVKSLPWKDEYKVTGLTKEEWETQLTLKEQKAFLSMAKLDPNKAYAEQYNRMIEQYEALIVKSLPWKTEYHKNGDKMTEEIWKTKDLQQQKEWLESIGLDAKKAISEQYWKLEKENEEKKKR